MKKWSNSVQTVQITFNYKYLLLYFKGEKKGGKFNNFNRKKKTLTLKFKVQKSCDKVFVFDSAVHIPRLLFTISSVNPKIFRIWY